MTKQSILVALLIVGMSGCCPNIALNDWSSAAPSLLGDWVWKVLTLDMVSWTSDADGDPVKVQIVSSAAEGDANSIGVIPDGKSRSLDGTTIEGDVTYVALARATKSDQADTIAENDDALVELDIMLYVLDQEAFGLCPVHFMTVSYTFKGKFNAGGQALGEVIFKITPTELAAGLTDEVAAQVSKLAALEPYLATWENVTMTRP